MKIRLQLTTAHWQKYLLCSVTVSSVFLFEFKSRKTRICYLKCYEERKAALPFMKRPPETAFGAATAIRLSENTLVESDLIPTVCSAGSVHEPGKCSAAVASLFNSSPQSYLTGA